jgi:CubicO group peptidase (beta-lactamase class C family)
MAGGTFSAKGLDHLHRVMAGHIEQGAMPGLTLVVAAGGRIHIEAIGTGSFDDPVPLAPDAIFRIASLTKPIVATAAMTLVGEGRLGLDQPVETWLPELAGRRVLRTLESDLSDTVAAHRAITVEDLLSFRLGFGVVFGAGEPYPIQVAEAELGLKTLGPPWPPTPWTSEEWIERFSRLPLMRQPGEAWLYNTGATVLGILLERVTGLSLQSLLEERLFGPLGMEDTAFSVPPGKLGRLTTAYSPDPETGVLTVLDGVADSYWSKPPKLADAGGWLTSTVTDYWAFAQMLARGGEVGGHRILPDDAVAQMTTDRLTAEQCRASTLFLGEDGGWGLGLRVPARDRPGTGTSGGYGWDGGTGTTWRTDPDTGLTGILFTQRAMTSPAQPEVFTDFWDAARPLLDD